MVTGRGAAMIAMLGISCAAGCGSAPVSNNPPPAPPANSPPLSEPPAGKPTAASPPTRGRPNATLGDGSIAVLRTRARTLELRDAAGRTVASAPAGVGPTHAVSDGDALVFVVDTAGNGLLLFHTRPHLALNRRAYLPGRPYAMAIDPVRKHLWVTLTASNQLAEVAADARPRLLRILPTVRQPNDVTVDPRTGIVTVRGRDQTVRVRDAGS